MSGDPWGDPHRPDRDLGWRLHCQRTGAASLDRAGYDRAVDAWLSRADAVLSGAVPTPDPELERLGRQLGLARNLPADPRRPKAIDAVPTAAELLRIATDIAPSVGVDAPERLVGPWATALDARRPADRDVLRAILAASCFLVVDEDRYGRTPFVQWVRRKPHPEMDFRERVRAVEHAAPSVWRIVAREGGRLEIEDLVGISHRARPDRPVHVRLLASVEGAGAAGDLLLARVVRTEAGWVAPFALALRGLPDLAVLRSWVRLESRLATLDRRIPSVDDLLRLRPHVLWRRAHEWAWSRT